jgi:hypothetical protein
MEGIIVGSVEFLASFSTMRLVVCLRERQRDRERETERQRDRETESTKHAVSVIFSG